MQTKLSYNGTTHLVSNERYYIEGATGLAECYNYEIVQLIQPEEGLPVGWHHLPTHATVALVRKEKASFIGIRKDCLKPANYNCFKG